MTNVTGVRKASAGRRSSSATLKPCKTCTSCRLKKVRCCGTQPKCAECIHDELECFYPQDNRTQPRPSRACVKGLETTVAALLQRLKAAGLVSQNTTTEEWISNSMNEVGVSDISTPRAEHQLERTRPQDEGSTTVSDVTNMSPTKTSAAAATTMTVGQRPPGALSSPSPSVNNMDGSAETCTGMDFLMDYSDMGRTPDADNVATDAVQHMTPTSTTISCIMAAASQARPVLVETAKSDVSGRSRQDEKGRLSGLSPGEATVAGVSHENGRISSVHGLSSVMNRQSGRFHDKLANAGTVLEEETWTAASKARLISYAALQSQREAWVYNQPNMNIDLDGCDVDLAKHLIELHFSIQHYVYLISYRPAIIDSLASGGGPWVNKLMLNAIYYSSALFSNRLSVREDPDDPQTIGSRFYDRFFQLLGGEIARPSIPSAVGLLLMSASLISHGRPSAGWNLSGLAYRMVIDLGCHLTPGPDFQAQTTASSNSRGVLNQDIELEMRKRLYWGAFATDATQALYLGRPCMLAPVEARVPLCFLDTFEELEKWEPYVDPQTPLHGVRPPPFTPQPAHAVSTFGTVARLLHISTRITKLYGIDAIKSQGQELRMELAGIEGQLQQWTDSLPSHLLFDPEGPSIPPPHKVTPHTTFHALNILLHRAFLEDGHLCHHSDKDVTIRSEDACIHSALMIEKLLRCFRNTFTLRGAPFLLCYATYSAVTIILGQERRHRGQFMENISFFWTCLSEMQRGCNFGMTKPLALLKEMVREYNISIKLSGTGANTSLEGEGGGQRSPLVGLDESFFEFPLPWPALGDGMSDDAVLVSGEDNFMHYPFNSSDAMADVDFSRSDALVAGGTMTYLDEKEQQIWQDTLYGLFTSPLPFG